MRPFIAGNWGVRGRAHRPCGGARGSGVGASVAANKIPGVRAGLIHNVFSAHQGVEMT
jgi:hypothetical protein